MTANFLVEIVKNLFGISQTSTADSEGGIESETNITVEHDPDEADTDTGTETGSETESDAAAEEAAEAEPAEADAGSADPVGDINGIGPTYSDRLNGIDIETVGDLVGADPDAVADAAQVSESRAEDWIAQAEDW